MRTKAFVVLTVVVAACGPAFGGDGGEPTGEELLGIGGNSGDGPGAGGTGGTGGTGGSGAVPSHCPDGSQGTEVTLQAGLTIPVGGVPVTWIDELNPNQNTFGSTACNINGNTSGTGSDRSCLLRWDVSYVIPPGKTVLAAWLLVTIFDSTSDSYPAYFMSRSWDAAFATWLNAASQTPWFAPGTKGKEDRSSVQFVTLPGGTPNGTRRFDAGVPGVQKVQEWVDNPASNFGIVIAHESNSDGMRIRTSSSATPAERPGLGIRYCL